MNKQHPLLTKSFLCSNCQLNPMTDSRNWKILNDGKSLYFHSKDSIYNDVVITTKDYVKIINNKKNKNKDENYD
ncbi:MAG: hypothetical protein HUJ61_04300 [Bacilli bacterium]|nr:hypothetical protein [Bacilli bacterium]